MLTLDSLETDLVGPVTLSVEAGDCVAILGESGSGKSLLLRAIADLDPNRGTVRLNGVDRDSLTAPDWRRRVMLVPAESGWWTDRVGDHFPQGVDATAILAALDLAEALDWQVSRLSTGERQRLAIARALCRDPQAVLLDEPTAALDQSTTERVETLIRAQCAAGKAVILVTHDPAQADRLARRRFRMRSGQLQPMSEVAS